VAEPRLRDRVFSNAIASVTQSVLTAALLWIMYRYLLGQMGVEKVGIWSVVTAAAAIVRLGDFGIGASVVRFVAYYSGRGEPDRAAAIIETAAVSVAALAGPILMAVYLLGPWLLGRLLGREPLRLALEILPWVLLTLWTSFMGNVCVAALDGLQRVDQRSVAMLLGSAVQLGAVAVLVPVLDIQGLAYAGVLQAGAVAGIGWILLKRQVRGLSVVPHRWTGAAFGELLRYGASFQFISAATLFYDPVTKVLLTRFGGLAVTGYYELGSRLLGQVRSFILAASQVVVPVIATLHARRPESVRSVLRESQQAVAFLAVPLYCLIGGTAPLIAELWLGRYETSFVLALVIVGTGWLANVLGAPTYFRNLGTGDLGPNTLSHLTTGLVNGLLGLLLGWGWGYRGVLSAWALALIAGTAVLLQGPYRRRELDPIVPREGRSLVLVSGLGLVLALGFYYAVRPEWSLAAVCAIVAGILAPTVVLSVWLHPLRGMLLAWAIRGLRGEPSRPG
jgi:O-antigen/teichoic acid export membrane protein